MLTICLNEGGSKSYELSQQLEWLKSSSGTKLDSSWSSNIDLDCKCRPLVNRFDQTMYIMYTAVFVYIQLYSPFSRIKIKYKNSQTRTHN